MNHFSIALFSGLSAFTSGAATFVLLLADHERVGMGKVFAIYAGAILAAIFFGFILNLARDLDNQL